MDSSSSAAANSSVVPSPAMDAEEEALLSAPLPEDGEESDALDVISDEEEEDDATAGSSQAAKRQKTVAGSAAARKKPARPLDPVKAREQAEAAKQLASVRAEQARLQKSRLRFLLGQSELFSHFLSIADGGSAPPAAGAGTSSSNSSSGAGASTSSAPSASAVGRSPSKHRAREQESAAAAVGRRGGKGASAGGKRGREGDGDDGGEPSSSPAAGDGEEGGMRPSTRLTAQPAIVSPKFQLRDYQLEGLNWMISLHENGLNGILADEMGLGKTFQTISLLGWFAQSQPAAGGLGPHIVLVPKSVLSNWVNEFARFCPALKVITLHGDKEARQAVIRGALRPGVPHSERGGWNVLLTTYEVAVIERGPLSRLQWQYVVIDEAHRIKNEHSALAQTARELVSTHRLLITGTPLQNNLHELWALLNFLLPDVFGSSTAFDSWFERASASSDAEAQSAVVRQLHRVLRPFMIRRLKADVAKSLPPKTETLLYVGMTPLQRTLYRSILLRDVNAVMRGNERGALSNLLMHLRKAALHPYLFEGQEDRTLDPMGEHLVQHCAKLQLLDKLLPRLRARGSRVLIFSQFASMLDILEDYCVIRSYESCRIDGSTSYDDRESGIESFNAPGSSKFVFLLSTRAGGLGINLATADIVILFDSDWNPQVDLQAQDRAHRIGQTKPVKVYRLVTAGSVEEKIIERAWVKLKLDAVVVQQGRLADKAAAAQQQGGGGLKLSKEEMLEMVQFGADSIFRAGGGDSDGASGDGVISDKDIDAILSLGEQKTKEMADAVAAKVGGTGGGGGLLDFKMDGGMSTQTFEGVDYKDTAARKRAQDEAEAARQRSLRNALVAGMSAAQSAEGERAARRAAEVYRALDSEDAGAAGGAGSGKQLSEAARLRLLLAPAHRPPSRMDPFQLNDKRRIMEICAAQIAWGSPEERAAREAARVARREAKAAKRAAAAGGAVAEGTVTSAAPSAASGGAMLVDEAGGAGASASHSAVGAAPSPAGVAAMEVEVLGDSDSESEGHSDDAPIDVGPFPQALVDERARLVSEGFAGWKRDDFEAYVKTVARLGRGDSKSIVREVSASRGKAPAEVSRYHAAFWGGRGEACLSGAGSGSGSGPSDWAKVLAKVRSGETALASQARGAQSLVLRLARGIATSGGGAGLPATHLVTPPKASAGASSSSPASDTATLPASPFLPRGLDPWTTIPLAPSALSNVSTGLGTAGWSREADALLLACVASQTLRAPLPGGSGSGSSGGADRATAGSPSEFASGALDFAAIRGAFLASPALRFDYSARAHSEEDLRARAKLLLRAAEREAVDAARKELKAAGGGAEGEGGPHGGSASEDLRRRLAEGIVKAAGLYKQVQDAEASEKRAAARSAAASSSAAGGDAGKAGGKSGAGASASSAGASPVKALKQSKLKMVTSSAATGDAASSSHAPTGGGGGGKARPVPPSLVPLLCRLIADGGAKGVDVLAADFASHPEVVAACGPPPARKEKGGEGEADGAPAPAPAPAPAAGAGGPFPHHQPSRAQVLATIDVLGVKAKPTGGAKAVWGLREGQPTALAGMSPRAAEAELAACPLVLPAHAPKPKKSEAGAGEGEGSTAAAGAAGSASAGAASAAPAGGDSAPPAPPAPTLPEPQLARLAQLVDARPDAPADALVALMVLNEPSVSKAKARDNLRAIGERGAVKGRLWAVRPEFARLLALQLPGRPLQTTVPQQAEGAQAGGSSAAAAGGVSAPVPAAAAVPKPAPSAAAAAAGGPVSSLARLSVGAAGGGAAGK